MKVTMRLTSLPDARQIQVPVRPGTSVIFAEKDVNNRQPVARFMDPDDGVYELPMSQIVSVDPS